ncbi:hypothetical protein B0J11DRAFT_508834 [Dendryphion nanum]|uniref:Uncharacterized protein n=1 Tax=Dendryphion nanum TaxID=256645 RepID=A0A9P9DGE8_9PLEO|nr:hypothetical protein B0J11DRAFT_508834 [Dendryphion nanum]
MATCVDCKDPLVIEIEPDEEEEQPIASSSGKAPAAASETVPDDVHLNCGCHFHWQCLLEAYQITQCPNCSQNIASTSATGQQQVLCDLNNEGGLQTNLDILPLLAEESYLKAYPEERKCRAFLEFCREGDFKAICGMLDDDEDSDEEMGDVEDETGSTRPKITASTLLRYQDPMGDMQSGLHAAVQAQSREVAWLLLLLASNLDLLSFPAEVFQEAEVFGIMRGESGEDEVDIRSLKDAEGKSAEDLAKEIGGVWSEFVAKGWLRA